VGFNDSRVTLRSDYWGQGAHSALPIVGEFFQRAQRSRLVDSRVKFDTAQEPGWFAERTGRMREWFHQLFAAAPAKPEKPVVTRSPVRRAPAAPVVAGASAAVAAPAVSAVPESAVEPRALPQPPLLPAPGSAPAAANGAVDGEAHGGGEPAIAPTPTPDDVVPPDAGNQGSEGASTNAGGASH
jgi:penicillin-binding protein 1A